MTENPWRMPPIVDNHDRAVEHLEQYFLSDRYSGRLYDSINRGDGASVANAITPDDIVATQLLSIRFLRSAQVELLDSDTQRSITRLLTEIPRDASVETPEGRELLRSSNSLLELWQVVTSIHDILDTKASKLLARKRPHLIPIYDDYVAKAFDRANPSTSWVRDIWRGTASLFENADVIETLRNLRAAVAGIEHISLLRVLDVVVWMEEKSR